MPATRQWILHFLLNPQKAGSGTGRINGMQFYMRPHREDASPYIRSPKTGWRIGFLVCPMIASLIAGPPVLADDFDPFVVYEEAGTLNDHWQACAAAFVRERIHLRQDSEILAKAAFERCQARADRLSSFLVVRIGRTGAGNVMALLLEKYRVGLSAAIKELRTRP